MIERVLAESTTQHASSAAADRAPAKRSHRSNSNSPNNGTPVARKLAYTNETRHTTVIRRGDQSCAMSAHSSRGVIARSTRVKKRAPRCGRNVKSAARGNAALIATPIACGRSINARNNTAPITVAHANPQIADRAPCVEKYSCHDKYSQGTLIATAAIPTQPHHTGNSPSPAQASPSVPPHPKHAISNPSSLRRASGRSRIVHNKMTRAVSTDTSEAIACNSKRGRPISAS